MCELLALSFESAVKPAEWFSALIPRAVKHPHGWGIAYADGEEIRIEREPVNAASSPRAAEIAADQTLSTPMFVGHIRDASCGVVALKNTHPFRSKVRESDLVLAHNGTLDRDKLLGEFSSPPYPAGETDSELALLWLKQELEQAGQSLNDFEAVHRLCGRLNRFGKLNLILTDGVNVLIYRDHQGRRNLHYKKVQTHPEGYVIATEPLDDQGLWETVPPGALLAFSGGRLLFESPRGEMT